MSSSGLKRPAETTSSILSADADDLSRLRALLLADDRVQLDARTAALEYALAQAVTKDDFSERLIGELAKALKRAERNDPKAVARAISPAVVQSIRREIVNSREDMVEALYPITGRMVRAAVRDAFSSLIADLNKRLDALTSPALLKAHAKSIVLRKPASSFLIADSADQLSLKRGLLIDRQSGTLVHSWKSEGDTDNSDESSLVSSMFAAISTFTAENYDGPDAELRTLDLNGRHVALRHSARHMLVVEHIGAMNSTAAAHIDGSFEQIVENVEDADTLTGIALLQPANHHAETATNKKSPAKIIFAAVGFSAIALLGWHIGDRVWFAGQTDIIHKHIALEAPFHAPAIVTDRNNRSIIVRGLVPPGFELQSVIEPLNEVGITVINQTQPVAGANDLSAAQRDVDTQLTVLANELADLRTLSVSQGDDIADRIERLSVQIASADTSLEERLSSADARISALSDDFAALDGGSANQTDQLLTLDERAAANAQQLEALRQRLDQERVARIANAVAAIEGKTITFTDGTAYAEPALAANHIASITELARMYNFELIVQGYSDEVGSTQTNERVSRERADEIARQLTSSGLLVDQVTVEALGAVPDRHGLTARQVRVVVVKKDG